MESGSSMPLAGFVILLLLLWLNGIFYGFSAAVHNLSENEAEKRAQEGDKKAVFLLSLIKNPVSFVNAIPLIVMAVSAHSQLQACGENVGLPEGQMGNSEVGHLNIGAGREIGRASCRERV